MAESFLYPDSYDVFTTKVDRDEALGIPGDGVIAKYMNDVQDRLVNVQNVLGLDPAGNNTLKERIEGVIDVDGKLIGMPYTVIDASRGDDADDIQTAIDALTSTGGTVWVMPGTYTLTSDLLLKSNVNLVGGGREKTIIDGDTETYSVLGNGVTTVVVSGLKFNQCSRGIYIYGSSSKVVIQNNWFEACLRGVLLSGIVESSVVGNSFRNCGQVGLEVEAASTECWFRNNRFYNSGSEGLKMFNVVKSVATGNIISDCGSHGILLQQVVNCVVANNVSWDNLYGIYVHDTSNHNTASINVLYSNTTANLRQGAGVGNVFVGNVDW